MLIARGVRPLFRFKRQISNLVDKALFRQRCYVDGRWIDSDRGSTINVISPSTNKQIGTVPNFSAAETRRAIESSSRAWPVWKSKTARERSLVIRRFYELMIKHTADLAAILNAEQGKPMSEATGEIQYAAAFLEVFADEASRSYGDVLPELQRDVRVLVTKEPIGVVGAITPWNFPSAMVTRKCGAALAAGCTVVLKPSELTPFSALALAELGERAGLPAGALNIITGSAAEVGGELTKNPIVKKITFTGSTRVGKLLMEQSANTVKKVSLELGGNAPFIVFDDADLEKAAAGLIACKFRNMGQTCVSPNRVFVQSGVYEKFSQIFAGKVSALKVGTEAGCQQGPLINKAAIDKVERHLADAVSKGGKVLVGGKRVQHDECKQLFQPTVLLNANKNMLFFNEETFGPVAPLIKFETEDEAIALANDTSAGLAAYFFTNDSSRIWRVSERLQYGMVGVNQGSVSHPAAPFGGVKESGFGREGSHKYSFDDYTVMKTTHINVGGSAPVAGKR